MPVLLDTRPGCPTRDPHAAQGHRTAEYSGASRLHARLRQGPPEQADRAGARVGDISALTIVRHMQQMSDALADAHDPIDRAGLQVETPDGLGALGSESQTILHKSQPVQAGQRRGIDRRLRPAGLQVEHVAKPPGGIEHQCRQPNGADPQRGGHGGQSA